ncbi:MULTISPECIES: RNA 2',3'-cyclic phosphodiesterase [unclassified Shinella]|jgi:2'-5' RNA ligase|uniref:RNA 2',3'-cyclic phosphodiesterase n=1 Tax=unclassified Shinella TaxID=2643062 RepID=UPI000437AD32|nr:MULTISPECIES: RNA 2',3'-cyclic phosphodiesterase [unclassified Shinella]EYR78957.1 2'-5' RNA ligase [Shinella sp. DD12]KNY13940.1 2'-5' RNA ligase [Shinella sp. SUS2]KOC72752.1 2'-5' RNA ligase [Shinella sp. GWS1]MCO5154937.1 RNA 2',3'-cyclic phosphodiesterase [Shinella sp.]MDC7263851.1 RNA 2',3'-cyclic phosphodiesterase [Shinella sp. HY16]
MPRLFVALEVPRNAAMSLSLLRGGLPGARWIDVENFHITLRFIGDIDGRTADEVVDKLDRIERPEFQLALSGMGSFGSKKPHSVFAGVTQAPEMYALQGEIERICQRLGLPADPRKFTPHVTLARLRNARTEDVAHYLSGRGNFYTAPFTVNRFVLMSSKESVGGGPYLTEEVFPLYEAGGGWDSADLRDHLI